MFSRVSCTHVYPLDCVKIVSRNQFVKYMRNLALNYAPENNRKHHFFAIGEVRRIDSGARLDVIVKAEASNSKSSWRKTVEAKN